MLLAANASVFLQSLLGILRPYLLEFLIVVVASVVASLLYDTYRDRRAKPKFVIHEKESPSEDKLGFGVQVLKRTIEEARPLCNGVYFDWIEKDGSRLRSKTLYGRDPEPSFFYPFRIERTFENAEKNQERMTVSVLDETRNGEVILYVKHTYTTPEQAKLEGVEPTFMQIAFVEAEVKKWWRRAKKKQKSPPTQPPSAPASNQATPQVRYAPSSAMIGPVSVPRLIIKKRIGIVGKGAEESKDYELAFTFSAPVYSSDGGFPPKVSFSLEVEEVSRWRLFINFFRRDTR